MTEIRPGDLFMPHHMFERDRPDEAERARAANTSRVDRGLPPAREFPCLGALRYCDTGPRPIVVCDVCQFEISVPPVDPSAEPVQVSKGAFL